MKTTSTTPRLISGAVISGDGKYRYKLERNWSRKAPPVVWIMLNPSTADAAQNDPTIRRCISFSKRWGFGGIEVYNLFAVRSPSPSMIEMERDPIGPDNDTWLTLAVRSCRKVIAAWGACQTEIRSVRAMQVMEILTECGCAGPASLGLTKSGQPRHPLYVPVDAKLVPYAGAT